MGHDTSKVAENSKVIHYGGEHVLTELKGFLYNDDEISTFESDNKDFSSSEINLQELISLKMQFAYKELYSNIKSSQFMITVDIKDCMEKRSKNAAIDLVIVIDRSFSMKGQKMNYVIKSLLGFLDFMEDIDRLCIIAFDDSVQRLTPLIHTTKENKKLLRQKIIEIKPIGGTNIGKAAQHALEVLKQRRVQNIASIFLLSDGVDKDCDIKIKNTFSKDSHYFTNPIVINTFGYGKDHDPQVMSNIAQIGGGSFYFIDDQKLDNIFETLASCLGQMTSIVAKDITLSVNVNEGIEIQKLYGAQFGFKQSEEDWFDDENINYIDNKSVITFESDYHLKNENLIIKNNNSNKLQSFSLNLPQLISGRSYNFIFDVNFKQIPDNDFMYIAKARLSLAALGTSKDNLRGYILSNLQINITNKDSEENIDVFLNLIKAKCGEILLKAKELCDKFKYKESIELINDFLLENKLLSTDIDINSIYYNEKDLLISLRKDLQHFIIALQPNNYLTFGKAEVAQGVRAHLFQQSTYKSSFNRDYYSNKKQNEYVDNAQSIKERFFLGS